jgi:hypothetical protein
VITSVSRSFKDLHRIWSPERSVRPHREREAHLKWSIRRLLDLGRGRALQFHLMIHAMPLGKYDGHDRGCSISRHSVMSLTCNFQNAHRVPLYRTTCGWSFTSFAVAVLNLAVKPSHAKELLAFSSGFSHLCKIWHVPNLKLTSEWIIHPISWRRAEIYVRGIEFCKIGSKRCGKACPGVYLLLWYTYIVEKGRFKDNLHLL